MQTQVPRLLAVTLLATVAAACGSSDSSSPGDGGAQQDSASPGDDASATSDAAPGADGGSDAAGQGIGLASKYPCDNGLKGDPAVVFAEDFEEGSIPAVTSRYDSANDPPGMALVADVPSRSCGKASIGLTAGGASSATDLYKRLPGNEELFVRYYAKYQAGIDWHHTGVWFGGYDPALAYPNPQAGLKPNGDDRISVSIEPVFGNGNPNPRLDTYNYWMQMHSWMDQPMGSTAYYGNSLVHQNGFQVDDGAWMCLEVHVKLNSDPASSAGAELDVWKNDALVQHFDDKAPLGYWVKDKFCPMGADGSECTSYPPPSGTKMVPLDLQWRSTSALTLNYFWPQNYVTQGPPGRVQYDDMVVATVRVGCLTPAR